MSINIPTKRSIRTIRRDDQNFMITDGMYVTPRAGFELSKDCPAYVQQSIEQAVSRGWIKSVAYMTEREYMLIGLAKD